MHQINKNASKSKKLYEMKQPLAILQKLKLMFTSYAELFSSSITEKVIHGVLKERSRLKLSGITFIQCYSERYFFITLRISITPHNRFMRNPVLPWIFVYFTQCIT